MIVDHRLQVYKNYKNLNIKESILFDSFIFKILAYYLNKTYNKGRPFIKHMNLLGFIHLYLLKGRKNYL